MNNELQRELNIHKQKNSNYKDVYQKEYNDLENHCAQMEEKFLNACLKVMLMSVEVQRLKVENNAYL